MLPSYFRCMSYWYTTLHSPSQALRTVRLISRSHGSGVGDCGGGHILPGNLGAGDGHLKLRGRLEADVRIALVNMVDEKVGTRAVGTVDEGLELLDGDVVLALPAAKERTIFVRWRESVVVHVELVVLLEHALHFGLAEGRHLVPESLDAVR